MALVTDGRDHGEYQIKQHSSFFPGTRREGLRRQLLIQETQAIVGCHCSNIFNINLHQVLIRRRNTRLYKHQALEIYRCLLARDWFDEL